MSDYQPRAAGDWGEDDDAREYRSVASFDTAARHLAASRAQLGPRINRVIRDGSEINHEVAMRRAREMNAESSAPYIPDEETEGDE